MIEEFQKLLKFRAKDRLEARDYIKENTKNSRARADRRSKSHFALLKFLMNCSDDEVIQLARHYEVSQTGDPQKLRILLSQIEP